MTIKALGSHPLYADSAYRLYAFLLEQLPEVEAAWLHGVENKAISQHITFHRETNTNIWTIHVLSEEANRILSPVLRELSELNIENTVFSIAEKTCSEITAEALIQKGRQWHTHRNTLVFSTPTAFKQNGRYTIFPQEKLLLQSLIRRWNEVFSAYALEDEDAFNALLAGIHIVDYQLRTTRFSLKGVKIPGFLGSCVIEAKLSLPLQALWTTLLLFANDSGIGIKTSLGMGAVSLRAVSAGDDKTLDGL